MIKPPANAPPVKRLAYDIFVKLKTTRTQMAAEYGVPVSASDSVEVIRRALGWQK